MDPTSTTAIITAASSGVNEWADLFTQLGFGSIIFVAFMFLLKWVLKTQEKILDNSKEERATSLIVVQGFLKTLEQISIQSNEFHKQVTEAHAYQRNEHEKMLEGLNNLCTNTQQNSICLNKIQDNLQEQGKILSRINGYQHD